MKNRTVIIVFVIVIVLLLLFTIFGFHFGKIEIPSVSQIIEKDKNINEQINKQSQLTSVEYPKTISEFESTVNDLNTEKEKYEQVAGFEEGESKYYETEQYDISYLWKQLGRLATKHKINLAIDVKKASGVDMYDMYFTIQGDYVSVSSYIKKIEDDSTLHFRIYNFKLVPGQSTIQLKCTFAVKDVRIDPKTLIEKTTSASDNTTNNEKDNNNNDNNNNNNDNNNSNTQENQNSTENNQLGSNNSEQNPDENGTVQ